MTWETTGQAGKNKDLHKHISTLRKFRQRMQLAENSSNQHINVHFRGKGSGWREGRGGGCLQWERKRGGSEVSGGRGKGAGEREG